MSEKASNLFKMRPPWKLNGITSVIKTIQLLYIDHYPFHYKPPFQWVVNQGVLRVVMVTYRIPETRFLFKLFPLAVTLGCALVAFCCILVFPWEYLRDPSTPVWMDMRLWAWICSGGGAAILAFVYRMIAFGDESTFLATVDQTINLELEMRQGNGMNVF